MSVDFRFLECYSSYGFWSNLRPESLTWTSAQLLFVRLTLEYDLGAVALLKSYR